MRERFRGISEALWLILVVLAAPSSSAAGPVSAGAHAVGTRLLQVDHLMIGTPPHAPERAALARAGFRINPEVNPHEGQGSASVMVELENGFLELVWRDDSVSVSPGLERVAERFRRQGAWRTSGTSPFAIGLRRGDGAPDTLPFPTRPIRAAWMYEGGQIDLITPATDSLGARFFVASRSMAADGKSGSPSERDRLANTSAFDHPNHARRITAVQVTVPKATPTTDLVARYSPITFRVGREWRLDVTFDDGVQRRTHDLRPALPLVLHF